MAASAATPAPPANRVFQKFPNLDIAKSDHSDIKLLLVNSGVTRDIDWPEIIFDLNENIPFTRAQSLSHIRVYSESDLLVFTVAIETFREPASFLEQFVTDSLRRFD
jgi:hypothetical protein